MEKSARYIELLKKRSAEQACLQRDLMEESSQRRALEAQAGILLESISDAVLLCSLTGAVVSWNGMAENLFGYLARELPDVSLKELVPATAGDFPAGDVASPAPEAITRRPGEGVRKDGSRFPILFSLSPLPTSEQVLCVISDVSASRQQELALARMGRLLEDAQRANTEFFNNVSHEFRNPLTAILGFSALLLKGGSGDLSDDQRRFLQDVHDSGSRLLAMVNDIITLSRFEADQEPLSCSRVDVEALIHSSLAAAGEKVSARRIQTTVAIDREGLFCEGDGEKLCKVVTALLENAAKISPPEGSVVIRVGEQQAAISPGLSETMLLFTVSGFSKGLHGQESHKIFSPFQQFAALFAESWESSGASLALCRSIIQRHGGRIWVEAAPEHGPAFCFTIPVKGKKTLTLKHIIDPQTSFLSWESFTRHIQRLISLCKRDKKQFALLRFDLEQGEENSTMPGLVERLRTAHRDHEILACCPAWQDCLYLILWDADRETAQRTIARLNAIDWGKSDRLTHVKTLIYPENRDGIEALLKIAQAS